jgi:hypothetical protein
LQSIYTIGHLKSIGTKRPKKRTEVDVATLAFELRRSSVLAHLDASSLTSLARDASVELHGVGTTVIQQGDTGSCMHVIVAGQVLIMIKEQKEQGYNEIKDVLASDWIKSKEASGQVGIR